jgi:hypothetical protein
MTAVQNFKQSGGAGPGQQDQHVEAFGQQLLTELERDRIVFERDFAQGRSHQRFAAVARDQSRHFRRHARFKRSDGQPVKPRTGHRTP